MTRLAAWSLPVTLMVSAPLAAQAHPSQWAGVWFTEMGAQVQISGFPTGASRPSSPTPTPPLPLFNPNGPWRDEARATLIERFNGGGKGKAEAWGYPLMMVGLTPLEFVVTPRETLILSSYRDIRHVMTDGRSLSAPEDRWVTTWGESVGRWDGDTLVIETVAVRQPNVFFISPPFSENAHFTERLQLVGPDRIEGEMTIVDPESLTEPWVLKLAYVRAEGLDRLVYDTFTNDRSQLEGEVYAILPPGQNAARPQDEAIRARRSLP